MTMRFFSQNQTKRLRKTLNYDWIHENRSMDLDKGREQLQRLTPTDICQLSRLIKVCKIKFNRFLIFQYICRKNIICDLCYFFDTAIAYSKLSFSCDKNIKFNTKITILERDYKYNLLSYKKTPNGGKGGTYIFLSIYVKLL